MSPQSIGFIVLVNLLPLAGVIWLGWRIDTLVLLYWAEAVVVGLFALLRILCAGAGVGWRLLIGLFFVGHYGTFCLCALALITAFLFNDEARLGAAFWEPPLALLSSWSVLVSLALLAAPQAIDFIRWLRSDRPAHTRISDEMARPYPKVFLMMAVTAACGYVAFETGQPLWAIILLVAAKTAGDLATAWRTRQREVKQSSLAVTSGPA